MGDAYPILRERQTEILGAILREETAFARTLDAGTIHLEEALIPLTGAERVIGRLAETLPADAPVLPGDVAFRLHDTYGFPIDLTVELAGEYGVRVDRAGFEVALEEQRQRSRSGRKADLSRQAGATALYDGIARSTGDTRFLGYDTTRRRAASWPSCGTPRATRSWRRGRRWSCASTPAPRPSWCSTRRPSTPSGAARWATPARSATRRPTSCCSRSRTPSGRSAA